MNPVLVLIVVIGILSSIASKKRKEAMKKKAEQQNVFPPQHSPYAKTSTPTKPAATSRSTQSASSNTSSKKPSRGVDSKWPWPTAAEKAQTNPKPAAGSNYGGTPRYTHVVTSTLEGGHTHTESSMTGEEACPPPKAVVQKPAAVQTPSPAPAGALLDFHPNNVVQGILYSEILGKPKALRSN